MSIARKMQLAAAGVVSGWDLANAAFNGVGYFGKYEDLFRDSVPADLFFKPDGTQMYMVGSGSDRVYEYSLSVAWEVRTASFVRNFSVATQETVPTGLFFKDDGTRMYVCGSTGDDVNEYSLSTAWNISTATFVQVFSVAGQETAPQSVSFKDDGTRMYILGSVGDDVNEYSLSTAWDISTASYVQNFSVATQETSPTGLFFKPDGTKMYVCGSSGDDVNEYSLSTAWDISTASYVQNFSVAAEEIDPNGVFFKDDGTEMYIIGLDDTFWQYTLTTPWDISTAAVAVPTSAFYMGSFNLSPYAGYIKPDGTKMYALASNRVDEIDISTPWAVDTASFVRSFSVSGQETLATGLFFKDDGTKMYVSGQAGDDINEYNLSTAWNISTASFVQLTSIANDSINPSSLYFKPDGTKFYFIDDDDNAVIGYNMSSAWDISTASGPTYPGRYVVTENGLIRGIYIKQDDGTKMYIVGQGTTGGDRVYEYNLSVAWDISSATFVQSFDVAAQDTAPTGLFFKDDGTKMYVMGDTGNDINEYALSTAWNISTATYTTVFSVSTRDTAPTGLAFKTDGTEMYVLGSSTDDLFQFTLSTAWDISTATFTRSKANPTGVTGIQDAQFSSDGTKYYLLDSPGFGSTVYQFNLSTAWDISTATQGNSIAVKGQAPRNFTFKSDGTKMYITSTTPNSRVFSFTLSTAWDITTASYDAPTSNYYWLSETDIPQGIYFKPDGSIMYTTDDNGSTADQYNLSTPWDVTTASYAKQFSFGSSFEPVPSTIFFRDTDGKKMYISGTYNAVLWEFDL